MEPIHLDHAVIISDDERDALFLIHRLATTGARYINTNRGCLGMKPLPYAEALEVVEKLLKREFPEVI